MFIVSERIRVTLGENTIIIRAKMDYATRAACIDQVNRAALEGGGMLAAYEGTARLALLEHNILAWEGPAFEGVPCTRENIRRLDPDDSLVEMVREEISVRNRPPESPDPNSITASGSTTAGG